jgi:hypothetical protein
MVIARQRLAKKRLNVKLRSCMTVLRVVAIGSGDGERVLFVSEHEKKRGGLGLTTTD